jgi:hypothetical protein
LGTWTRRYFDCVCAAGTATYAAAHIFGGAASGVDVVTGASGVIDAGASGVSNPLLGGNRVSNEHAPTNMTMTPNRIARASYIF